MKWEQFEQMYPYTQEFINKALTNIECPKCGKNLFQRTDIVLTSYPAQYQYECECGFIGYSHAQWSEMGANGHQFALKNFGMWGFKGNDDAISEGCNR